MPKKLFMEINKNTDKMKLTPQNFSVGLAFGILNERKG
jgi:hypothetical protein